MWIGEFVIIRTRSAGVHFGVLAQCAANNGLMCAVLTKARRLWSWKGANSLHEISLHGVESSSRISEEAERIFLPEVIEVIPCTAKARKNLEQSRWDA